MKRQIPNSVFILGVMAAILVGLWVLGTYAPESAASAQDREFREALAKLQMPDFQGKTMDGQDFRISDYKGKVVLVNFWATWCGPCKMELPDLMKLQKDYGPKGFTIVGLSQDASDAPVRAFLKQEPLNYPIIMEPEGIAKALEVQALPTSFLVDRNGKIVYATQGVDESKSTRDMWAAEIDKVI